MGLIKASSLFIVVSLLTLVWSASVFAEDFKSRIESDFISSMHNEEAREYAKSQGSILVDLDGDGKEELVIVWTLLGPTYWHNTLTVLTKDSGTYTPVASLPLIGEAKLASVKNGIITVDQKVYANDDPRCCPTIEKQFDYRWDGERIRALNQEKP